jgi:hypothetical protein
MEKEKRNKEMNTTFSISIVITCKDMRQHRVTIRNKNSRGRLSVDSPLQFKTKNKVLKYNLTNYITSKRNFISIKDAKKLGKVFFFECPYKMGEYEKTTGKNSKPAFVLSKKTKI